MQKPLATREKIEMRIRAASAYDTQRRFYNEARWAMGSKTQLSGSEGVGTWAAFGAAIFEEFHIESEEIGAFKQILTSAEIAMSRLLTGDIRPQFQGLNETYRSVREEFWRARFTHPGEGGQWHEEIAAAWLDGDNHGVGVLRVGIVEDEDGDRVALAHVPNYHCLFDPHSRNLWRSRYICFIDAVPLEEAVERFGQVAKDHARRWNGGNFSGEAGQIVPVTEYFDIGIGGDAPTRAFVLGRDHIVEPEANPVGAQLPRTLMLGFHPSGMKLPIGRAIAQRAAAELYQMLIDDLKSKGEAGGGFRWINKALLGNATLSDALRKAKINGGLIEVDFTSPEIARGNAVSGSVPPAQVDPTLLQLIGETKNEQREQSRIPEINRAQVPTRKEAATTNALLHQAGIANQSGSVHRTIKFLEHAVRMVMDMAVKFDTAPLDINVYRQIIRMNDPRQPSSAMKGWLEKPARAVISKEQLTAEDTQFQRGMELQKHMQLVPFLESEQGDGISREWFMRRLCEILDLSPDEAIKRSPRQATPMPSADEAIQQQFPARPGEQSASPGLDGALAAAIAGMR